MTPFPSSIKSRNDHAPVNYRAFVRKSQQHMSQKNKQQKQWAMADYRGRANPMPAAPHDENDCTNFILPGLKG